MLQSHFVALDVIVVAPLTVDKTANGIDVSVEHDGSTYVMAVSEIGSVRRESLRRPVGSLAAHEDDIRRALDRLFSGF